MERCAPPVAGERGSAPDRGQSQRAGVEIESLADELAVFRFSSTVSSSLIAAIWMWDN
jgi:hypothetical protein